MSKNVLSIVLLVIVFGAGFLLGRFTPVANTVVTGTQDPSSETASEATTSGIKEDTNQDTVEGNVAIDTTNLTDGQRKLLSALGIDADTVTVTPEMITCAETSLGDDRVAEITGGATPSFTEGVKLAACY